MFVYCVYALHEEAKRWGWDPLELELESAVSCYLGAGYQNWVLWTCKQCSKFLRHLSSHTRLFNLDRACLSVCLPI